MKKLIIFSIVLMLMCSCAEAQQIKITALPADTSPTTDDLVMTVDGPSGIPANKKVTLGNFRTLMLAGNGSNLTNMTMSQITGSLAESRLSFTNITDGNVSTSKHGFAPILPNDATKYLDGTGAYTIPSVAAAGGWTDGGATISLATLSDKVGIGTASPAVALDVVGAITATGAITGGSFVGNASTATLANTASALQTNGANCSAGYAPLGVNASGAVEGCFSVMTPAAIDTSAELKAIVTDETGSGSLVFNTTPTFSGTVTATAFAGDGSALTGLATSFTNSSGLRGMLSDEVGVGYAVFNDSPTFTNVMTLPNSLTPTIDVVGKTALDTNLWAASRGAIVVHDGTASTALVGALTSDVPSNGQVPKWNTGGTITWENDNNTSGITAADTQVIYSDGANNPVGDSGLTYNKATNALTADQFITTAVSNPKIGFYDSDATDGDENANINVDCGTVTSGAEDCELSFWGQVAGTSIYHGGFSDDQFDVTSTLLSDLNGGMVVNNNSVQTVGSGATIAITQKDCGSIVPLDSAGNVTTNTTDTLTDIGAYATGCCVHLINVDATDTITLDNNAKFASAGGANVALGPKDTATACYYSTGTIWYQTAGSNN